MKHYSKFQFQWPETVDNGLFFRMRRDIIDDLLWAGLPTASQAVYPTLLTFVSRHGLAYPSLRTLAIMSGVTEKTAGNGIRNLEGIPGFTKYLEYNRRGHPSYQYEIKEPLADSDHSIIFRHAYFDGGNWCQVSPTGKAVFPVLKHLAWWKFYEYCELEDIEFREMEMINVFKDRDYDFMDAAEEHICQLAGICRRSLPGAFASLTENYLTEPLETEEGAKLWKVFTVPQMYYKRDMLNEQTKNRYGERKILPTKHVMKHVLKHVLKHVKSM